MKRTEFGLILLSVAIPILVLVGAGGIRHRPSLSSQRKLTAQEVREVERAIASYAQDCGRPPNLAEGLAALVTNVSARGWKGPYLRDRLSTGASVTTATPRDVWGVPLRYRFVDGRPLVDSAGADGQFDTADDIR